MAASNSLSSATFNPGLLSFNQDAFYLAVHFMECLFNVVKHEDSEGRSDGRY